MRLSSLAIAPRLAISGLAGLLWILGLVLPCSADSRVVLMLISPANASGTSDVTTWVGLLQNHVPTLLPRLSPEDISLGRHDLTVRFQIEGVTATPADMHSYWDPAQTLYLVSLVPIFQTTEGTTKIDNRILLGEFKGSLRGEYVNFSQIVVPEQFEPSRDAMIFVTLYTYAMYRANESIGGNPNSVCDAIGQAKLVGEGLPNLTAIFPADLLASLIEIGRTRGCPS